MLIDKIKYFTLFALTALLLPLTGCIDDKLNDEPGAGGETTESDGYYLALRMALPSMSRAGSSDFEAGEDAIDLNGIKFLFLYGDVSDSKCNTLYREFGYSDVEIIPVASSEGLTEWYVRFPVDNLGEDFAEFLRKHDFKIAVKANWPAGKGTLTAETTTTAGDNINQLHQISEDSGIDSNAFGFLMKDGKSGVYTDWANALTIFNETTADAWIRQNWNPAIDANPEAKAGKTGFQYSSDRGWDYTDLWLCWNFGGNADDNLLKYTNSGDKWEARNGSALSDWIEDITNGSTEGVISEDFSTSETETRNPLVFKADENSKAVKTGGYYGVKLAKAATEEGAVTDETPGVFSFTAPASGTLYLNAAGGALTVQIGEGQPQTLKFGNNPEEQSLSVTLTGDSQPLYIYNAGNEDVTLYQIEYIQGSYLFNTARKGKGTSDQKIPMYGVRGYKSLGNLWKKGTTFDLSNFSGTTPSSYDNGPVYLLRSVAKIEILIPKSFGAHHVYLRNANATARVEPMDVSSDTEKIWKDFTNGSNHTANNADKSCEFFTIRYHQPFYNSTDNNYPDYQKNLAWYFGSWNEFGLLGSGVDVPGEDYGKGSEVTGTVDYPRVMNPRVVTTDFIEFTKVEETADIERYVLYIGDKFVDDPAGFDGSGNPIGDPKVCHIEFRSSNQSLYDDPFTNLDDDNCYRIYFIEEGFNKNNTGSYPTFETIEGVYDNWENSYEKNTGNLRKHWPIIRNHYYSFEVQDADSRYLNVKLKVVPWAKQEFTVTW